MGAIRAGEFGRKGVLAAGLIAFSSSSKTVRSVEHLRSTPSQTCSSSRVDGGHSFREYCEPVAQTYREQYPDFAIPWHKAGDGRDKDALGARHTNTLAHSARYPRRDPVELAEDIRMAIIVGLPDTSSSTGLARRILLDATELLAMISTSKDQLC